MGGNYIQLTPGGSNKAIQPGGEITVTQGAVDLLGLIGKAMFSSKGGLDDTPAAGADPLALPKL